MRGALWVGPARSLGLVWLPARQVALVLGVLGVLVGQLLLEEGLLQGPALPPLRCPLWVGVGYSSPRLQGYQQGPWTGGPGVNTATLRLRRHHNEGDVIVTSRD